MNQLITISPNIQSGEPVFTGTRVPVKNLFDYLSEGDHIETFLKDFPSVTKEHALAVLELAGKIVTLSLSGEHESVN
ncbi:MAG: DUF433 domain-containing protein [Fimbriimonadaceae bacterium]|nr:DUF433 domain-containing protein [Chitinophagales bacterium]